MPGTGKVTINGRDGLDYFGRQQLVDDATAPFRVTDTVNHFDVVATCTGGGITGQSGAVRGRRRTQQENQSQKVRRFHRR